MSKMKVMMAAMAIMMGGMGAGMGHGRHREDPQLPRDPSRTRSFLENCYIFLRRLTEYNADKAKHKKAKSFKVQGFYIYAFKEAQAKKRIRKLMADTYLSPELTHKQVKDEIGKVKTKEEETL